MLDLNIPDETGTVEEVFEGNSNNSPVIYIQDAHNSFEAQENIAKIVQQLVKEKGIQKVLIEGYEGRELLDDLFPIEDTGKKEKVARFSASVRQSHSTLPKYLRNDHYFSSTIFFVCDHSPVVRR